MKNYNYGFDSVSFVCELDFQCAMLMAEFTNFQEYFVKQVFAFFAKSWGTKYERRNFSDQREEKFCDSKGVGSRFLDNDQLAKNADRQGGVRRFFRPTREKKYRKISRKASHEREHRERKWLVLWRWPHNLLRERCLGI